MKPIPPVTRIDVLEAPVDLGTVLSFVILSFTSNLSVSTDRGLTTGFDINNRCLQGSALSTGCVFEVRNALRAGQPVPFKLSLQIAP